jgi:arginyl-tRNA synthetase
MLIYGYKHFRDDAALKANPVREMVRLYKKVQELIEPSEMSPAARQEQGVSEDAVRRGVEVAEAARLETARLHAGDPENTRLWQAFMPHALEEIERIYRRLGVTFDHQHGESFYNPMLPDVAKELAAKGIAERSQGALVVFFGENDPPAIVQKGDGAFTYMTSDLATIRYRVNEWHPDAILYVVDFRQALHFKHLFDAARRWGYGNVELEHISFGSVLGENNRPLKTREGGVVELSSLLDEAVQRAEQVYEASRQEAVNRGEDADELGADERRRIAEAVGIGAVKYADLSQNRTSDYVFSFPKMLAMNGNTATYMQYAYARNRSIFRRAGVDAAKYRTSPPPVLLPTPYERALAVQLLRLQERLEMAAAEYQPSLITSYLWDLAKTYSGFFQNCPVIKAETPELRESRLLLCDLTARVLQLCLSLLGIKTVERM